MASSAILHRESIERFRVNEVSCQIFQQVENSWSSGAVLT